MLQEGRQHPPQPGAQLVQLVELLVQPVGLPELLALQLEEPVELRAMLAAALPWSLQH
jgi:hypothetical protein